MKIKLGVFFYLFLFVFASPVFAKEARYFLEGDGTLDLQNVKTGKGATIRYRQPDGSYSEAAQSKINDIFGISPNSSEGSSDKISLRLIALMDFLQDHFKGGQIRMNSGYRSPVYNEGLRKKGKLAAKTSMHIEGMAADFEMGGVNAKTLWEYVRSLDCCGVGYYHGKGTHLDTGPSRFWDETSTKVEQDLGGHNKLLLLRTEYDRYQPGEKVRLSVSRVTDYPIGVQSKDVFQDDRCHSLEDRKAAKNLVWQIPEDFKKSGKFQIEIKICDKLFPEMPDRIISNPILVTD